MANPKLVNAVGGGDLEQELNLDHLHEDLDGEENRYDPEYWPGIHFRFTSDSPAILIFRTGKYNIAGAESIDELLETNDRFLKHIQELGFNGRESNFEIRNLVYLDEYGQELSLDELILGLGLENAEYEPEQFPGILFRPTEAKGTFLIFQNGKVVFTGSKDTESVNKSFDALFDLFDSLFH